MNRRQALIALAEGKKIRSSYLCDPTAYLKMSVLGAILKIQEGSQPTPVALPDVEFEEFNPTEEVGVVAYVSKATIDRLSDDDFSTTIQARSEPNKFSYIPVRITWDQEVGLNDEQEVQGQEVQH